MSCDNIDLGVVRFNFTVMLLNNRAMQNMIKIKINEPNGCFRPMYPSLMPMQFWASSDFSHFTELAHCRQICSIDTAMWTLLSSGRTVTLVKKNDRKSTF